MLELYLKLEIWHVSIHTYLLSKNIPFSTKALLMLLMLALFFAKNQRFFSQNSTFTKSNRLRAVRFFSSVFRFCKIKGYYWWKHKFYWLCIWNLASRLLQIGPKLEYRQWRSNFLIWRHFWSCFVSIVKFSYWSKFHVNFITGSGVMIISFYKGLTRNLEIRNTPVWVFLNIWRLE